VVSRKLIVIAGAALIGALAACSAIIGTRDLELATTSDAGGTPVNDSTAPLPDSNVGPGNDSGNDVVTPPPEGGSPEAASTCGGADLSNDPKNCGTCGHDCLGGTCGPMVDGGASVCQPVPIAAAQPIGPWGIALSAGNVYWSNSVTNQILTAAKDGGGVNVVAHDPQDGGEVSSPADLQTDDKFVYWMDNLSNSDMTNPGRIARCPLAGCGDAASTVVATNIGYPIGLKVDDAGVYWGDYYSGAILAANKTDGGIRLLTVDSAQSVAQDLAVDPSYVYWSTSSEYDRVSKDAGGPDGGPYSQLYVTGLFLDRPVSPGIAIDDTNLYFVINTDPDGLVQFIPKGGVGSGQPTTIASSLHNPFRVAVDATNVYWVNQGPDTGSDPAGGVSQFLSGTIMMCPKAGCPAGPTLLAQNQAWPMYIAVDDQAVYWTNQGNNLNDGAVMKVAK
jgi:hypothetical protein